MDSAVHAGRLRAQVADDLDSLFLSPELKQKLILPADLRSYFRNAGVLVRSTPQGLQIPATGVRLLTELNPQLEIIWTPDAKRFVENRVNLAVVHDQVHETIQRIKLGGVETARSMIQDCNGLGVLDAHQIVNVAAMTVEHGPGLCLFDEQGAGKTVTLIFAFDLLVERNEADTALIVAPKSMIGEWPKDLSRFRGDIYQTEVLTGTATQKRRGLSTNSDVYITNFESAVSLESELRTLLKARPERTILVVDESFFIKSLDAKRTKALRRLREWAGRTYVLCGSPAPNSPVDLIQQSNLVDFGHCFNDVPIPKDKNSASAAVHNAFERKGLFCRHLKIDVLPYLPIKRFQRISVTMSAAQANLYRETSDELIRDVVETNDIDFLAKKQTFLSRKIKLLQLCSNPIGLVPNYQETPAKLIALDELLDQLVKARKEKVVIWSFFTASLTAICQRYSHYGVTRYDGFVSDTVQRLEAVNKFQNDDETMVFVANPAAAGAGLTLHRSCIAIYESFSNQAAHYLQSLDRIHRRGQDREVEYLILLCEGTVEVNEYQRLLDKERDAQDLLGDRIAPPITRESFLRDLQTEVTSFDRSDR